MRACVVPPDRTQTTADATSCIRRPLDRTYSTPPWARERDRGPSACYLFGTALAAGSARRCHSNVCRCNAPGDAPNAGSGSPRRRHQGDDLFAVRGPTRALRTCPNPRCRSVKSRYPCSVLAPVVVLQLGGVQAALMRWGRPPGLAKAPCSRERSWRMGWVLMTSPPEEISTTSPTIAICTWRRRCARCRPGSWSPAKLIAAARSRPCGSPLGRRWLAEVGGSSSWRARAGQRPVCRGDAAVRGSRRAPRDGRC